MLVHKSLAFVTGWKDIIYTENESKYFISFLFEIETHKSNLSWE